MSLEQTQQPSSGTRVTRQSHRQRQDEHNSCHPELNSYCVLVAAIAKALSESVALLNQPFRESADRCFRMRRLREEPAHAVWLHSV